MASDEGFGRLQLFAVCVHCAGAILMSIKDRHQTSIAQLSDCAEPAAVMVTSCESCQRVGPDHSDESESLNRSHRPTDPRVSTKILATSDVYRTLRVAGGGSVYVAEGTEDCVRYESTSVLRRRLGREDRVCGVDVGLGLDAASDSLILPYLPGGFL